MTLRVLITGMSGTGKSTVAAELAHLGYRAIDLDDPDYSELVPALEGELTGVGDGMDWVWNAERVADLLDSASDKHLFVSGCSPNQGLLYPRFVRVILLTAPVDVIRERLATRTTNNFGKDPDELERTMALTEEIEPRLRLAADAVIDTTQPLPHVVAQILRVTKCS